MFLEFLIQNWPLILILIGFTITLKMTVFLDKKTINRIYLLIILIFLLSVLVYIEFYLADLKKYNLLRSIFIAIRYSSIPFIIALIIFAVVRRQRWFVFIPAILLAIVNIISIFTGIVFSINDEGEFVRGFLGYLPFIMIGLYGIFLTYLLFKHSNGQITEIIPNVFLVFVLFTDLLLPFILKSDFSKIFCTTVAIALFIYYVFQILQLTKKDALTGLLNRQAYYATLDNTSSDITALISLDMNGLKKINDNYGHAAGDEALVSLAISFSRALNRKQLAYRIGGDEFFIICKKCSNEEVMELIDRINKNVSETNYTCSLGYSFRDNNKTIDDMIKESDAMMYREKAFYHHQMEELNNESTTKIES